MMKTGGKKKKKKKKNTIKESKASKLILYSQKCTNIYIYISSVVCPAEALNIELPSDAYNNIH